MPMLAIPLIQHRLADAAAASARARCATSTTWAMRCCIVATDRISAFDYVLGSGIPDKGKVLTQLSVFWFDAARRRRPQPLHHDWTSTHVPGGGAAIRRRCCAADRCWCARRRPSNRVRGARVPVGLGLEGVSADAARCAASRCRQDSRVRSPARADLHARDQGEHRARHQHRRGRRGQARWGTRRCSRVSAR